MNAIGGLFVIAGALLALVGAIGVVRFEDFLSRIHAASKAPTLGLILVATGVAFELGTLLAFSTLTLLVALQLLTAPVATHMLGRAAHGHVEVHLDGEDELARDKLLWAAASNASAETDGSGAAPSAEPPGP